MKTQHLSRQEVIPFYVFGNANWHKFQCFEIWTPFSIWWMIHMKQMAMDTHYTGWQLVCCCLFYQQIFVHHFFGAGGGAGCTLYKTDYSQVQKWGWCFRRHQIYQTHCDLIEGLHILRNLTKECFNISIFLFYYFLFFMKCKSLKDHMGRIYIYMLIAYISIYDI